MQKHYSGVSEYTYRLLLEIFAQDSENEYVLFYNARKNLEQYLPEFNFPNVTYKEFRYPNKLLNLGMRFFGWPTIDQLLGGVEVFFSPNVNFSAFSSQTRKVVTVHDLSFIQHPEFFDWKHQLWHRLSQPLNQIKKADHVIAVSEHTKRDCIELLGVPEEKITVIYEALSTPTPPPLTTSTIRETYNLPEKFLLYLGTIEPRKNITSIIQALDDVHETIPLVIAGKKGWKYDEILKEAALRKDRVMFIDYVPAQDKFALLQAATLFVWPSFYEGFGIPPLEAQAMGTPVITAANSSLVEVVGDSAFLVNPDLVNQLSFAINELLSNPELYASYVEKGYTNIQRFSWQKAAQETLEVFKNVCE
jgi:glycosyltransferase involved in cell wall biosynthesis